MSTKPAPSSSSTADAGRGAGGSPSGAANPPPATAATAHSTAGASDRITAEVLTWPGARAATGSRGEWAFKLGRRELGHLHGDTTAHFGFGKATWRELHAAGRIDYHPVFPGREGPAARRIQNAADEADVIALLRINYDYLASRQPPGATRDTA